MTMSFNAFFCAVCCTIYLVQWVLRKAVCKVHHWRLLLLVIVEVLNTFLFSNINLSFSFCILMPLQLFCVCIDTKWWELGETCFCKWITYLNSFLCCLCACVQTQGQACALREKVVNHCVLLVCERGHWRMEWRSTAVEINGYHVRQMTCAVWNAHLNFFLK